MILITGGTGFLGQALVQELLAAGHSLRLLVRNAWERRFPWQDLVEIIEGDVLDIVSLEKAMEGVEKVIHAAAMVSFWAAQKEQMFAVNVKGTANVVDACLEAGVQRLVHVSSISALGVPAEGNIVDELTPWVQGKNASPYGISKKKAEAEVYRGVVEGLDTVILNPGVILGPATDWQNGTPKIFSIIDKGLRFYQKGATGYVGLGDVASACHLALDAEVESGDRFILVAENHSYHQIFSWIAEDLGKKAPRWSVPGGMAMGIGAISETISFFNKKAPIISRASMRGATVEKHFDGSKIKDLGLQYQSVRKVIQETAQKYLQSNQSEKSHADH